MDDTAHTEDGTNTSLETVHMDEMENTIQVGGSTATPSSQGENTWRQLTQTQRDAFLMQQMQVFQLQKEKHEKGETTELGGETTHSDDDGSGTAVISSEGNWENQTLQADPDAKRNPYPLEERAERTGAPPRRATSTRVVELPTEDSVDINEPVFPQGGEAPQCWICLENNADEYTGQMIRPCVCNSYVHQRCLRDWRYSAINPKFSFHCPNCATAYRFRKQIPTQEQKRNVTVRYFLRCARFFLLLLLFIVVCVGAWSALSWALDRQEKNIPVGMKYIGSSVLNGFPNANSTKDWQAEFKRPDVTTWPYYTTFGTLLFCIQVLIIFCFNGCSFDEDERRKEVCHCNDSGSNGGGCYCYCYYSDCNWASDSCCNSNSGGGSCGSCSSVKCDGEGALLVFLVLVIIVVVVVLFSGVFIVVGYAARKVTVYFDRYSTRAKAKSEEELGLSEVVDREEPEFTAAPLEMIEEHGAGNMMV